MYFMCNTTLVAIQVIAAKVPANAKQTLNCFHYLQQSIFSTHGGILLVPNKPKVACSSSPYMLLVTTIAFALLKQHLNMLINVKWMQMKYTVWQIVIETPKFECTKYWVNGWNIHLGIHRPSRGCGSCRTNNLAIETTSTKPRLG